MPIRRTIDHAGKVVTTQCEGLMTLADIQVEQRLFWSQDWIAGYGEVFDMRAADFSEVLAARSRYAPVVASNENANLIPVAMVYDHRDETQSALATRYIEGRRALSDQSICEGFEDISAAENWLRQRL